MGVFERANARPSSDRWMRPYWGETMIGYARGRLKKALLEFVHRRNETARRRHSESGRLPPSLWDLNVSADGHLIWSGCDLIELTRRHGTPLHVVNKDRLKSNYDSFLEAFRAGYPQVDVAYSYKSNPVPGVLAALDEFGALAEVISHYELWLALHLGVPPERIIFNGPAKPRDALELAVSRGVGMINLDSESEIAPIVELARAYGRRQPVGVRVVTSVGWASQFGIPIRDGRAAQAFERLARCEGVSPEGIHIHLGTGIHDIDVYVQAIREVLEFSAELAATRNIHLRHFDFGGGFGVPTVRGYSEWDHRLMRNGYPPAPLDPEAAPSIHAYAEAIAGLITDYMNGHTEVVPHIILEPGRAITSSAQCLLLSLINVKTGLNNQRYAVADGGKNLAMPVGYELHEVFVASRMRDATESSYSIVGPLCYPEDVLVRARAFPELRPGDTLAIMDAGAYFISNQQTFSNPRPAIAMVSNGQATLLRERETFENMIERDR